MCIPPNRSAEHRQEVTGTRSMATIHVVVYHPKTEEGIEALARRVADVHASSVIQRLKALHCPAQQKEELLDAIIHTVSKRIEANG